jgi:hypothetical protein
MSRLAPVLSRPGLLGRSPRSASLPPAASADPGLDNDVVMGKVQTPWRRVSQSMITGRAGAGQQTRGRRALRRAAGSLIHREWLVHVRSGRG